MYRDIIAALRRGNTPPTDLAPYVEEAEKERVEAAARMAALRGGGGGGGSSSSMGSGGSRRNVGGGGGGGGSNASSHQSMSAGGSTSNAGDGAETPLQRDARLKAEAQERLRAKFGAGGLKSQSAGFDGEDAGGGGGGGGSSGADFDDFFNVNAWSARCAFCTRVCEPHALCARVQPTRHRPSSARALAPPAAARPK